MMRPSLAAALSAVALFAATVSVATESPSSSLASLPGMQSQEWDNLFSREPFPSMGIGSPHPNGPLQVQSDARPAPGYDWDKLFGREPFPGMGVGMPHKGRS